MTVISFLLSVGICLWLKVDSININDYMIFYHIFSMINTTIYIVNIKDINLINNKGILFEHDIIFKVEIKNC